MGALLWNLRLAFLMSLFILYGQFSIIYNLQGSSARSRQQPISARPFPPQRILKRR